MVGISLRVLRLMVLVTVFEYVQTDCSPAQRSRPIEVYVPTGRGIYKAMSDADCNGAKFMVMVLSASSDDATDSTTG